MEWWIGGKRHRTDGPAVVYEDGSCEYWIANKRHREDGPALINSNGRQEWWINDMPYTEEEFLSLKENKRPTKEIVRQIIELSRQLGDAID
jgi:hypothetical protein